MTFMGQKTLTNTLHHFWKMLLDIQDQMWGLLSRRLGRSSRLLDSDSVCEILKDELAKPGLASFVNAKIIVSVLRNYRNWKQHTLQHSPMGFVSQPVKSTWASVSLVCWVGVQLLGRYF